MYDLNFDNILLEEKSSKNVVYKNLFGAKHLVLLLIDLLKI